MRVLEWFAALAARPIAILVFPELHRREWVRIALVSLTLIVFTHPGTALITAEENAKELADHHARLSSLETIRIVITVVWGGMAAGFLTALGWLHQRMTRQSKHFIERLGKTESDLKEDLVRHERDLGILQNCFQRIQDGLTRVETKVDLLRNGK